MKPTLNDTNHPDDARDQQPSDPEAHLPHERDENAGTGDATAEQGRQRASMKQAHEDVESGIEDTERRGIPSNVPSSQDNGQG